MTRTRGPLVLILLDGWGYSPRREGNAIALATVPTYDEIRNRYSRTLLEASGIRVGLPDGVMGNSEVGHLNIGAGRVIRTDVVRIDYAIETGEFFKNPTLVDTFRATESNKAAIHLIGLLSDGMVHSSQEHLHALLEMARAFNLERVYIHGFLDGRDTPPSSATEYIGRLQRKISAIGCGEIASLVGRYYAMDRDKRWERTRRAYDLLIKGEGKPARDPISAVEESHGNGVTDEFVEPIVIERRDGEPVARIREDDAVVCFNFRADRARQITAAIALPDFDAFEVDGKPATRFVCFTQYDRNFPLPVAFAPEKPRRILAELFGEQAVRNYRLAETEKYAHVTYFFNGGTEEPFPFERRLLVPSPKVPTYDLQPEMSAYEVTDNVVAAIREGESDMIIVNFANPDMVGHTGNLDRTIEAVEHIDKCLGRILSSLREADGQCLITSDHGNCEMMIDPETGERHTAHTTNPVPFHLIDEDRIGVGLREGGALEDVAPTILELLEIEKPEEMTGRSLFQGE